MRASSMNSGYGATDYKLEDTMDDEQARELLFREDLIALDNTAAYMHRNLACLTEEVPAENGATPMETDAPAAATTPAPPKPAKRWRCSWPKPSWSDAWPPASRSSRCSRSTAGRDRSNAAAKCSC